MIGQISKLTRAVLPLFTVLLLLLLLLLSSCEHRVDLPEKSYADSYPEQSPDDQQEFYEIAAASGCLNLEPAKTPLTLKVGLYNGVGSWEQNVEALENFFIENEINYALFNENDVASNSIRERFDLIWFPGGFAAEYRYYIPAIENIIAFVDQGGYYVGSCAGAYFAAAILSWRGKDHDYPLAFFDGAAVGPLVNEIGWGEKALLLLNPEMAANAGFTSPIPVYYFDGPYFDAAPGTDYFALASYETNNRPAIIAGRYGDGKYLLFGPHPEIGGINAQTGDYDLEGGNNAQWGWLLSVLYWFNQW